MRTIESNGGPLIAINRIDLPRWGGVDELLFFRNLSIQSNDYDYICFDAGEAGMLHVGKFQGSAGEIIYINYPLPTLIVEAGSKHIFIAQIDGAESDWSPEELLGSDFERVANWNDSFQVALKAGELIFFDAASVESDFNDDTLSVIVEAGSYRCEWARQAWEGKANMNFIRIVKEE